MFLFHLHHRYLLSMYRHQQR